MRKKVFCLFFFIIGNLFASVSYNTAKKIEKSSPILSIVLYEDILANSKNKKVIQNAVNRLYYLYMRYNKYDDLFILNHEHPPGKSTQKKIDKLLKKISHDFRIEEGVLKEVFKLTVQKDISYRKKLLDLLKSEHDDLTLKYILKYIFAIKIKIKDFESLRYIISEFPILYPDLRMVYYVASREENVDKVMQELSAISDLSHAEKLDLLFYYATYLKNIGQYRMFVFLE